MPCSECVSLPDQRATGSACECCSAGVVQRRVHGRRRCQFGLRGLLDDICTRAGEQGPRRQREVIRRRAARVSRVPVILPTAPASRRRPAPVFPLRNSAYRPCAASVNTYTSKVTSPSDNSPRTASRAPSSVSPVFQHAQRGVASHQVRCSVDVSSPSGRCQDYGDDVRVRRGLRVLFSTSCADLTLSRPRCLNRFCRSVPERNSMVCPARLDPRASAMHSSQSRVSTHDL